MTRKPQAFEATKSSGKKPLWQRLGWLVAIWTGSVLALGVVSYLLRLFMHAAGLTTP